MSSAFATRSPYYTGKINIISSDSRKRLWDGDSDVSSRSAYALLRFPPLGRLRSSALGRERMTALAAIMVSSASVRRRTPPIVTAQRSTSNLRPAIDLRYNKRCSRSAAAQAKSEESRIPAAERLNSPLCRCAICCGMKLHLIVRLQQKKEE